MSDLYKSFNNSDLEINGVVINVTETTRITLARAGGRNKKFERLKANILKPYQRRLIAGNVTEEQLQILLLPIYSKTVILNWETKKEEKWIIGIDGPDGILDFNKKNVEDTLTNLPDLYEDIRNVSNSISTFNSEEELGK